MDLGGCYNCPGWVDVVEWEEEEVGRKIYKCPCYYFYIINFSEVKIYGENLHTERVRKKGAKIS